MVLAFIELSLLGKCKAHKCPCCMTECEDAIRDEVEVGGMGTQREN